MSTSPTPGAAPRGNAQPAAYSDHGIHKSQLVVEKGKVVRDGFISAAVADELFDGWLAHINQNSAAQRSSAKVLFAISCSAGTSAETNFRERFLDVDNDETTIQVLVEMLEECHQLRMRTNKLRVLCRSMTGFPELTRDVILENPWLAAERASDYKVDLPAAGVCFDYADALRGKVQLSPTENQIIDYGLRMKAQGGRPIVFSGEKAALPGSDPASRGVAANMVPDSTRMSGNRFGASPYGS